MLKTKAQKPHNGLWISVLYFAEGFPYTLVNTMSVIFLKGLGASNELIGLTSLLSFPWVFKGLWGPFVDLFATKRKWILSMELGCIFLFVLLAFGVLLPQAINLSLVIFFIVAFFSATHDIAIDGFYLNVLNKEQQAFFVGVRNTAYRIAMLSGGGLLVFLAGKIAENHITGTNADGSKIYQNIDFHLFGNIWKIHPLQYGWAIAFGLSAIIFVAIYLFQRWYLPYPQKIEAISDPETDELIPPKTEDFLSPQNNDVTLTDPTEKKSFINSFSTYFQQPKVVWVLAFVLLFRLGDAITFKMAPPFLMDDIKKGGLAIATSDMGVLTGTVGVIFLLVGGLLGGFVIAKQGLKKWIFPMAIMQNSTNILYYFLAVHQPGIEWAYIVNSIEQFTYGLGVAAYTVFIMRTVRPQYEASHYAITTAFMSAGVLIPGIYSGFLQSSLGYANYFLLGAIATIPGMVTIFFLPWDATE